MPFGARSTSMSMLPSTERCHEKRRGYLLHLNGRAHMGRFIGFLYGLTAYLVFFVTFLYAIGFVEGWMVPKTIDSSPTVPLAEALLVILLLMSLFDAHHSVMALPRFKEWWRLFVATSVDW